MCALRLSALSTGGGIVWSPVLLVQAKFKLKFQIALKVLMVLCIYKWCSPFQGGHVAQILKTNSGSLHLGNNLLDDNWCQGSSGFFLLPFGIFIHNLLHNWSMCISAICFCCDSFNCWHGYNEVISSHLFAISRINFQMPLCHH